MEQKSRFADIEDVICDKTCSGSEGSVKGRTEVFSTGQIELAWSGHESRLNAEKEDLVHILHEHHYVCYSWLHFCCFVLVTWVRISDLHAFVPQTYSEPAHLVP
jgi:hypothetical protein